MVGTHAVLPTEDRNRITGFAINKFRGDVSLFDEGMTAITEQTGWVSLGVLPWFAEAWKLPAEDVMDIATRAGGAIKIAVPRLARISNFDDLDPAGRRAKCHRRKLLNKVTPCPVTRRW